MLHYRCSTIYTTMVRQVRHRLRTYGSQLACHRGWWGMLQIIPHPTGNRQVFVSVGDGFEQRIASSPRGEIVPTFYGILVARDCFRATRQLCTYHGQGSRIHLIRKLRGDVRATYVLPHSPVQTNANSSGNTATVRSSGSLRTTECHSRQGITGRGP